MENIQKINIDILNNKYSDYIYAKQHDLNRIIDFTITENGKVKELDDTYCTFLMKGKEVVSFKHLVRNDNVYRLELEANETYEAGKIPYQLVLSSGEVEIIEDEQGHYHIVWGDDGVILGTITSYLLIEECVVDDDDVATHFDTNILQDLIGAVQEAERTIDNATVIANNAITVTTTNATISQSYAVGGTDYDHEGVDDDVDNSKYYSKVAKSYAVGGTDYDHEGVDDDVDNSKYYYQRSRSIYNQVIFSRKAELLASDWDVDSHTQIIDVNGVMADEDYQLIVVRPKSTSMSEYARCNVMCTAQLNNQLEFHCDTIPSTDLDIYVNIQDVEVMDKIKESHFIIADEEPTGEQMNAGDFWIQPYGEEPEPDDTDEEEPSGEEEEP